MTSDSMSGSRYAYESAEQAWTDAYIAQRILDELLAQGRGLRVLDAGCGNGHLTARLSAEGFHMTGFDASESGVAHARVAYPGVRFEVASAYDNLLERFGQLFDACICIEVIEHLYDPRGFVRGVFNVLSPGGRFILSTPYHGYFKNVVLAVSGRMDAHFTVLWDGGHIKFWSRKTLTTVLQEAGFDVIRFQGAGRWPLLWKSMVLTARKPESG